MKNQQEKRYVGECEITENESGFILKCKKEKPAVKVQVEESEEE